MAITDVPNAVAFPQGPGTGLASVDDPVSAGLLSVSGGLLGYPNEYVVSDLSEGLDFVSRDGTNDTITIGTGVCFIRDTSTATFSSRGPSGNVGLQPEDDGNNPPSYAAEFPGDMVYAVVLPTQQTVDVSSGTTNQIWININDLTSNNQVEIRSDGGGGTTAVPSDTYIKLGEANPDDASQDTRANDFPALTLGALTLHGDLSDDQGNTIFDYSAQQIGSNLVNTTGLDLSIAPTWTGVHQFSAGIQDGSGNPMLDNVVASGSVTLSSGSATVDTGIATTNTATFYPALGPATDDADIGADIRADSGSGNYEVDFQETDTSVGNPTVEYDIIRVR